MIAPAHATAFLSALRTALAGSPDPAALAMRRIAQHFPHYNWVGIYWLRGASLELGPYVGAATEHTRIAIGQGVCGTAVAEDANQIIPDVREVANYLSCSVKTRAEIVVLIRRHGEVLGQIDADSDQTGAFDTSDEALLTEVAAELAAIVGAEEIERGVTRQLNATG